MNESTSLVKYAVRRNGRWETQVVDRITKVAYPDRNSIALDREGRPYIGYYDAGRGTLNIAHREGDRWLTEVVDTNFSGYTSSLQIQNETLWISYADQMTHTFKVAHKEISSPTGTPQKGVSASR
jgi:hypothetical protein